LFLSAVKVLLTNKLSHEENKKRLLHGNSLTPSSLVQCHEITSVLYYLVVVVSVGFGEVDVVSDGIEVVVSVGVDVLADVSIPVPDGWLVEVSLDIEGDEVSEPVEFSGVSQPIVANAKKAMKRMLFMRITLIN
jgi:hypothetical protein